MKKKALSLLLCGLMLLSSFTACTPSPTPGTEDTAGMTETEPAAEPSDKAETASAETESPAAEALTLVKDGVSDYVIVCGENADGTAVLSEADLRGRASHRNGYRRTRGKGDHRRKDQP